jgi:hypothetical protein
LIAFRTNGRGVQIYTVRPNGKDLQQITFLVAMVALAGLQTGADRFEHDAPGECANVAIMNADGNGVIEFPAPGVCGTIRHSPDGHGSYSIVLIPLPTTRL